MGDGGAGKPTTGNYETPARQSLLQRELLKQNTPLLLRKLTLESFLMLPIVALVTICIGKKWDENLI